MSLKKKEIWLFQQLFTSLKVCCFITSRVGSSMVLFIVANYEILTKVPVKIPKLASG